MAYREGPRGRYFRGLTTNNPLDTRLTRDSPTKPIELSCPSCKETGTHYNLKPGNEYFCPGCKISHTYKP